MGKERGQNEKKKKERMNPLDFMFITGGKANLKRETEILILGG